MNKKFLIGNDQGSNTLFIDDILFLNYGGDTSIRVFDLVTSRRKNVWNAHSGFITCLVKCKNFVVSASLDSTIRFWDIKEGVCFDQIYVSGMKPKSISLSPDQRMLLVADWSRRLRIIDLALRKQVWVYEEYHDIKKADWFCGNVNILLVLEDNVKILNIFYEYKVFRDEAENNEIS